MKVANLKIQLDSLRLALDNAFEDNNGNMIEIKKLYYAIQEKEQEFINCLPLN